MKYWLRVGGQLSAKAKEVNRETPTVMARARKNTQVTPVVAINGTNTTIGVMVENTSGVVISRKALLIASSRPCPASRCSATFSTTTIASSMTSPTAAARPPSVIRLKLWFSSLRIMKVINTVTGITKTATIEVPQSCRNNTIINDASTTPIRIASRTLLIDSVTISD